jgi:hypothetical protein
VTYSIILSCIVNACLRFKYRPHKITIVTLHLDNSDQEIVANVSDYLNIPYKLTNKRSPTTTEVRKAFYSNFLIADVPRNSFRFISTIQITIYNVYNRATMIICNMKHNY